MLKSKLFALIIASPLVFSLAIGQTPAAKKPPSKPPVTAPATAEVNKPTAETVHAPKTALPTNADIDAYMKRSFGYDPAVSWQIFDIRDSVVPGIAEVIVSVNKGEPYHLFFSPAA
ncbi:MAG TPA: hypothetical protein VE133_03275, partial [Candidatus Sulfotelmatobacter sp.]|nr:hypothetical protein [Candidatus Sulfotelmatobacter sp.]